MLKANRFVRQVVSENEKIVTDIFRNETAPDISVLIGKTNKDDSDDKAQTRSQPQNPEFRNNPEYFHPFYILCRTLG